MNISKIWDILYKEWGGDDYTYTCAVWGSRQQEYNIFHVICEQSSALNDKIYVCTLFT